MTRRLMWFPVAAVLVVAALSRPWSGSAEARPAPKAAAKCNADELTKLRAELVETKAQLAKAQSDVAKMLAVEKARAKRLEAQLGSPMIETLEGSPGLH